MSLSWSTGLPLQPSKFWQWLRRWFYRGDHRAYEARLERLAAEIDARPWYPRTAPAVPDWYASPEDFEAEWWTEFDPAAELVPVPMPLHPVVRLELQADTVVAYIDRLFKPLERRWAA